MRIWIILMLLCMLFFMTVAAQSNYTMPDYKPYDTSTKTNCDIFEIKMLQQAAVDSDLTTQQLHLGAANAYEQLSTVGAQC